MKIYFLILCPFIIFAQGKRDYVWLLGGNRTPTTDTSYQGFQIDFNTKPRSIYIKDRPNPILRQNNASICDKDGNLLMYTAGCHVSDRLHRVMPNGKINEGLVWDFYCKYGDYPLYNGTLIIPMVSKANEYIVLHRFLEFDPDPQLPGGTSTKLLYSIVDMNANNSFGDVKSKNQIVIEKHLSGGDLTAVRHANNIDWWILVPGRANDLYYSIQMTENGPRPFQTMQLGIPMQYLDDGGSQSCFSADGTKYARMTPSTGLFLMDFNRSNGQLSNFRNVTTGSETNDHSVGVAFSPNSRFVYLVYRFDLYQVDTWEKDVQASLVHIDSWDGYVEGGIWAAGFDAAMLGPDCKIYIRTGTSNRVMHVIHNPNEKGKACNFEQHGIQLPARNHASIPNFVNYRLGYEPVCDSTLTRTWDIFSDSNEAIGYPNLVQSIMNIELRNRKNFIQNISILDLNGQVVTKKSFLDANFKETIDLSNLDAGIYLVKVTDKSGQEYVIKSVKN
ncbi:MAG: T9SS type A sorting domain-containing protein [Saprospiraceae bacterium]|nr:T9SS type A sorting domain-containing protein [Candidatus Vicinibacter affinis]MBK7798900.1 T9SS type A sorting domain-containing protein [Candidatus Vicinibacter affinis]